MKKFEQLEKNDGRFTLHEVAQNFGIPQRRAQFLPGRFYSLRIQPTVNEITEDMAPALNAGRSYVDLNPIGFMLLHDNWKETALIVDIKAMPPAFSAKFLEAFWFFAGQNGLSTLYNGEELIPLTERGLIDRRFYTTPPTVLSQLVGASNLNYSINKYNIEQVTEARLIDWDAFGMLVRPRADLVGLYPQPVNLQRIYEEFLTNSI